MNVIQYAQQSTGWICGRCGISWSPYVTACSCRPVVYVPFVQWENPNSMEGGFWVEEVTTTTTTSAGPQTNSAPPDQGQDAGPKT